MFYKCLFGILVSMLLLMVLGSVWFSLRIATPTLIMLLSLSHSEDSKALICLSVYRGLHPAAQHHRALPEWHLPGVPASQLRTTVQAENSGAERERLELAAQVLVSADLPRAVGSWPEWDHRAARSHWIFDKVSLEEANFYVEVHGFIKVEWSWVHCQVSSTY